MPKGPVLGPLVICGVCFYKYALDQLLEIGVKDSKKLTAKKRQSLSERVIASCVKYKIISVSPQEIDQRFEKNINLNRLEELKMAQIINDLKPDVIYLDAADVNEKRFGKSIRSLLSYEAQNIISKHKADDLFPIVSAASIIAKHQRDALIEDLKLKYGEIGSGYPSDEKTSQFLREWIKKYKKAPDFARKTWETTKRIIFEEVGNKKITEYF
ncbi:MAG: ribonuclease HII [Promethearchaeota archaeon]|nr:MAG: ribonuclease HII [Candidatus Lokiarchaeota archaeon]